MKVTHYVLDGHAPAVVVDPQEGARLRWISTRQLVADSVRLAALLPRTVGAIAAVPRSGLIPASVIATYLHLPLYEIGAENGLRQLHHGGRGLHFGWAGQGRCLAVIDDTTFFGGTVRQVRRQLAGLDTFYAVVYCRPKAREVIDLCAEDLPAPHFLEWNFPNNATIRGECPDPHYAGGVAWDLDGVIVHDEHSGGPAGTPYLVPRTHACRLIATGRPESTRTETEAQLAALGVRWDRLEMLPNEVPLTPENAAAHKAGQLLDAGCGLFLESDPEQARLIASLCGRPVICPRAEAVFR